MAEIPFNNGDKNYPKMTPFEFYQALHKMHYAHRLADEMETLEQIDRVIELMDGEYPEADYLIQKIKRRLDNDKKY